MVMSKAEKLETRREYIRQYRIKNTEKLREYDRQYGIKYRQSPVYKAKLQNGYDVLELQHFFNFAKGKPFGPMYDCGLERFIPNNRLPTHLEYLGLIDKSKVLEAYHRDHPQLKTNPIIVEQYSFYQRFM